MLKENKPLEQLLSLGRKIIPHWVFRASQPVYHWLLAWAGAIVYRFPSRGMKIIGVTGTKGKSTTTFLIAKILEEAGEPVAAIGSLGYKIREKEWPNTLKMTMPGRMRLQHFLHQAKSAGCKYVVLEVTSEGIKQKRHLGIKFDCAVLTTIHREHIENHGSYEKYIQAKEQLFKKTNQTHILNADDPLFERFQKMPSQKTILYTAQDWERLGLKTELPGDFNKYNILAAASVAENYRVEPEVIRRAIAKINTIPGRMEFIWSEQGFWVVVDYAHTPDSLILVYDYLKRQLKRGGRLIAILGAAGGGRDKWKRPEFGKIAAHYCDEIILTNEDPYDEDPVQILAEVKSGISNSQSHGSLGISFPISNLFEIIDRKEAMRYALTKAKKGDIVVITGKGAETSMALANGQKIPWSDKEMVLSLLK
ncbi:MAG: hypothetical protein A3F25_00170 [Candidatus Yanofskybacteria bacterium RIFCSPHIGHO2_12_FULL_45_19b]|uniref:UDP-N-acetylmuramoyl-L-alanyl-D-glutamate--2, 6-diaminopimelate ligase n=1 Tax=Candidatus Yanofskybacteria bacterium RIFCSPHIGHO2_12_FULL_45_19b TaxID=1802689 RepID=A0A1F8G0K6_9BACT|nr:MAG: hypothetical protein A3F25_00170 [Candidatus Yanofskybacteria bacterium RIFCSPHIGHO2_12_FULL_45_19b]